MKKSYFNFLVVSSFLSLLLLSFISCASLPGEHAPSVKNAREGHYDKSLKYLEEHRKKVYGKKSDVLYYLDTGLLQHYQGEWTESINKLSAAEDEIYDLYTKSITTAIASFILNDNVLEYSGEDYEDIYLNVFNSLNYYYDGKIEDAVVETNRAINKITALQNKYQQELIKARSAAKLETKSKDIKSIAFHDSALAEYLRMLYCRAIGDYDGASTNQRMIKDAFVTQKALYNFSLPETIEEELSVPKGKARLNLLAFSGLSPVKTEIIIRDYGLADFSFALALPELKRIDYPFTKIVVRVEDAVTGKTVVQRLDLIESIENVATETFSLHRDVVYAKAVARSVTKSVTSNVGRAVGEELSRSDDGGLALAGGLLQLFSIGGNIAQQVSEHADMRISRYFPARASVAGITLEPGLYDIQIDYYGKGDDVLYSDWRENVNIKAGGLNLIESVCLGR